MRYRNVITRVCRENCTLLNNGACLLHSTSLEKIFINGEACYITCEKCIYKKSKNNGDDKTTPLFSEE